MKADNSFITTDIIDIVPACLAILMLALALLTLIYNKIFDTAMVLAHLSLPASGELLWIILAIAAVLMLLSFLRIWPGTLLRAATYLAWAIYLPSALYFSGIDLFRILSISANFGIFASGLSVKVVAVIGILLACLSMASRSFGRLKDAREHLLARGADRHDVRRALARNALFELKLVAFAGIATLLFAFLAPTISEAVLPVFKAAAITYLLAGLSAIGLLALVFLIILWPRKNGEKG